MSRRQKAAGANQITEAETVTCFCGGTEYDYSFVRFPMTHVSRCRKCGFEHRCDLLVPQPRARPSAPRAGEDPSIGFPPFWY
jgi:hypothetical protein